MKFAARSIQLLVGIAIAFVWLQSAIAHASNPYFFLGSVYKYKLVGAIAGRFIASVIPSIQFVLAICLLARFFVGGAMLGIALLLTLFSAVQASALVRGIKIECGCFGPESSAAVSHSSIAMAVCLAGVAYIGLACFYYGAPERANFNASRADVGGPPQ